MQRVFVINQYPVLPATNGGQHGVLGMTVELARRWPVELVWTQRRTSLAFEHEEGDVSFGVRVVPNLWRQRHLARWMRHGLGGRIEGDFAALLCSGSHQELIDHLVGSSRDGDIFVLEHPWLWPALRQVMRRRRGTLVYNAHNVESVLLRESLPKALLTPWVLDRVQRLEADLVRQADLVLACTTLDMQALRDLSGRSTEGFAVVGRGARSTPESRRSAAAHAAHAAHAASRVAVFVGARHPPNDAAARWIIETLAPRLPDWRFDIVGSCGTSCGVQPTTPNVRILGHVLGLGDVLAEASVGLNPITQGSGINMKAIEYLHFGLPVVSTPFGARGLESDGPNGMLVVDLPNFAATLRSVVADDARYQALSAQASGFARERLDWAAVGRRARERIQAVANARVSDAAAVPPRPAIPAPLGPRVPH